MEGTLLVFKKHFISLLIINNSCALFLWKVMALLKILLYMYYVFCYDLRYVLDELSVSVYLWCGGLERCTLYKTQVTCLWRVLLTSEENVYSYIMTSAISNIAAGKSWIWAKIPFINCLVHSLYWIHVYVINVHGRHTQYWPAHPNSGQCVTHPKRKHLKNIKHTVFVIVFIMETGLFVSIA